MHPVSFGPFRVVVVGGSIISGGGIRLRRTCHRLLSDRLSACGARVVDLTAKPIDLGCAFFRIGVTDLTQVVYTHLHQFDRQALVILPGVQDPQTPTRDVFALPEQLFLVGWRIKGLQIGNTGVNEDGSGRFPRVFISMLRLFLEEDGS